MKNLTIGELELLSDIKAHTIRTWEKRYNFLSPDRSNTNFRHYSVDQLQTLLNTSLLNKAGANISSIAGLDQDEILKKLHNACAAEGVQLQKLLNDMILLLFTGSEEDFSQVLNRAFNLYQPIDLITKVILPFLNKMHDLSHRPQRLVEHYLLYSVLKKKVLTAINYVATPVNAGKSVLIFSTSDEISYLRLLCFGFILQSEGINVHYIHYHSFDNLLERAVTSRKTAAVLLSVDSKKDCNNLMKLKLFEHPGQQMIVNVAPPNYNFCTAVSNVDNPTELLARLNG